MKKILINKITVFFCFAMLGTLSILCGCSDSADVKTDANTPIDIQEDNLQSGVEDLEPIEDVEAIAIETVETFTTDVENDESIESEENAEESLDIVAVEEESVETEPEENLAEEATIEEEIVEQEDPLAGVKVIILADLDIYYSSDYWHTYHENICIGNGEGITFSVSSKVDGFSPEDICIDYDAECLTVDFKETTSYDKNTTIQFYVTGKKECVTEIAFSTKYETLTQNEGKACKKYIVEKLNSTDGKVVYTTPTGRKYHYSAACAGDNAEPTTLIDAEGIYDACKKCAH